MNFIYTIFIFIVLATMILVTGILLPDQQASFVVQCISIPVYIATIITIMVMLFQNMELKKRLKVYFYKLKKYKKKKTIKENEMKLYKDEMENHLTKLYPEYEKEMFDKMNPKDAENLSTLLIQYPELKFNGILETYCNKIQKFNSDIADYDRYREDALESIENIYQSDWFMFKPAKPEHVVKALEEGC